MKKLLVVVVLLRTVAGAQSPAFEVVSVKPEAPDAPPARVGSIPFIYSPGGHRFRSSAITALSLVSQSFSTPGQVLRPTQIIGLPGWATTTRFEIIATTPADMTFEVATAQFRVMLQTVLDERFKLKAHPETRPFPVYALVVARADGRLGAAVKESTIDCAAAEKQVQEMLKTLSPAEMLASSRSGPIGCGLGGGAQGRVVGRGTSLAALTSALGVDRPVIDKTGLAGRYDFELTWSPPAPAGATPPDAPAVISEGPSVFTALQEQLGLKLERRDDLMPVLVIDHIEPPTPN